MSTTYWTASRCRSPSPQSRDPSGSSSLTTAATQPRTCSGSRQSPEFAFAIALAGKPLASGARRPPNVTWPRAPMAVASFRTWGVAGMSRCSADSFNGPLLTSHTDSFCSAAAFRLTNRRASRCHLLACNAPATITASKFAHPRRVAAVEDDAFVGTSQVLDRPDGDIGQRRRFGEEALGLVQPPSAPVEPQRRNNFAGDSFECAPLADRSMHP